MEVFDSQPFYLVAVAVMAATTTARHAIRIAAQAKGDDAVLRCLRHPLIEVLITLSTVGLGALVGLLSDLLPGETRTERVLVGVVAGFASKFGDSILKRLFPTLVGALPADAGRSVDAA